MSFDGINTPNAQVETDKGYRSVHPPLSPRASLPIYLPACYWITNSTRGHCETILFQIGDIVSLDSSVLHPPSQLQKPLFQQYDLYNFLSSVSIHSLCYMLFSPHLYILSSSLVLFWIHDGVYITFPFRSMYLLKSMSFFSL